MQFYQHHNQQSVPKLENFLDSASMVRYNTEQSQTDTQDSTLTHMYDHQQRAAGYYHTNNNNNGYDQQQQQQQGSSEVADSGCLNQLVDQFESGQRGQRFGGGGVFAQQQQPGANGGLSLGVNNSIISINNNNNLGTEEKEEVVAVAVVDSGKKASETFGQRTSIYRGVTRYTLILSFEFFESF